MDQENKEKKSAESRSAAPRKEKKSAAGSNAAKRENQMATRSNAATKNAATRSAQAAETTKSRAADATRLAGQAAESAASATRRASHAAGAIYNETMKKVHAEDMVLENEAETEKTPLERMQHALGVYDPDNLPDLYTQETGSSKKGYSTTYTLSPARLLRKQKLSGIMLLPVVLCVIVAALIAYTAYGWADSNILNANEQAQRKVSEQLSVIQDITLPQPATFIGQDDEAIASTTMAADAQVYRAQSSDASVSLVLYRVPPTLDVASAQTEITQGVNKLAPADAVKLLNGLWQFEVTRANGTTAMRFRYADFKSAGTGEAVTAAMLQQGLTEDTVSDAGVDDSGNTYKEGTTTINETQVSWRISVVPLSDMYSVKGLPASASYVGIRYSY